jgi:hypothetical protein
VGPDGLPRRLLTAAVLVLLVLAVPVGTVLLLAGPDAARAAALGAVFGLLLALRAGSRRGLLLVPALVVGAALGTLLAGSAGWVALIAALGLATGLATTVGALPGVALVGMVTSTTLDVQADAVADLPRTLVVTAVAATYVLLLSRRLALPEVAPAPRLTWHEAWPVAVALAATTGLGAVLGGQWDVPNAYWLPMTVFLVVMPTPGLRYSAAARQRVLGTAVGAGVAAVVAVVGPPTPLRAVLLVVMLVLVLVVVQPLWLNAALATVLVVTMLDPSRLAYEAAGTRLLATLEAVLLALGAAALLLAWGRWPGGREDERRLAGALAEAQTRT